MSGDVEAPGENKQHHGGEGSKKGEKWVEKKREAMMVVAGLIATMAYQAGLTPPGGLWQDDLKRNSISVAPSEALSEPHTAGYSILFDKDTLSYDIFIAFNTTAFVASLSIILLLVSGLPFFKKKCFVAVLTVVIWVAISSMAATYTISILASGDNDNNALTVLYVWGGLMVILILGHMIRGLAWIIGKRCCCCRSK